MIELTLSGLAASGRQRPACLRHFDSGEATHSHLDLGYTCANFPKYGTRLRLQEPSKACWRTLAAKTKTNMLGVFVFTRGLVL